MSVLADQEEREVVPRWRTFNASLATGDLGSLQPAGPSDASADIDRLWGDFQQFPELYVGADLLSALAAARQLDERGDAVAEFVLENSKNEPVLEMLARGFLSRENSTDPVAHDHSSLDSAGRARIQVRSIRRLLAVEPRNAIRRVDLALAQLTLGNHRSAQREMSSALQLAPGNRFVLRSAARFAINNDDFDMAYDLLTRTGMHHQDPWILAAAISSGQLARRPASEAREAREMLVSGRFGSRDLTELASEIATLELNSGHTKKARILFGQALKDPNENAVAQAEWASKAGGFQLPRELLSIERGFEARSRDFARLGNWAEATREGISWQADEPFALEPALNTSYAAALGLEDYETAQRVAEVGLVAHPHEALLRNNAAFAAASAGDLAAARFHVSQVSGFTEEEGFNTFHATQGLLLFREGNYDAGRKKYQEALDGFGRSTRKDLLPVAALLWAMEEVRISSALAPSVVKLARQLSETYKHSDAPLLLSRLETLLALDGTIESRKKVL